MHVIHLNKKRFTGPDSWEEVSPGQYRQFIRWLFYCGGETAGLFALLYAWFNIGYRQLRLLTDEQRTDLLALLDFMYVPPIFWLIPEIPGNGPFGSTRYIGPGNGLENLTFGEFMRAHAYYRAHLLDKKEEDLNGIVSCLYRQKAGPNEKKTESGRSAFDVDRLESNKRAVCGLNQLTQLGILFNFKGCLNEFPSLYPHLFRSGQEGGNETWLDVGLRLARQTTAFGTFFDLEKTDLFLVLTTLDSMIKEARELEAALKK